MHKAPKKQECPNCYFDKTTESSTGKCKWTVEEAREKQALWEAAHPGQIRFQWFNRGRCPVCKGMGFLEIRRKTSVYCMVVWGTGNRLGNTIVYTEAGTDGDTNVMLRADPKYMELFTNAQGLVVDGIECRISKPPVLKGLGNQAVLIVVASTTEKPNPDSGEIVKSY